ncbi:hypothetical protein HanRHA438_Chr17g0807531 [Helianthus annuus]|nr:hypothetical protein HanRHA438_Chr17g0807531 [Helianthus annuus]
MSHLIASLYRLILSVFIHHEFTVLLSFTFRYIDCPGHTTKIKHIKLQSSPPTTV